MILSYHFAKSQINISGKITDNEDLPLPGVTVFAPDMNKGTVSDIKGNYKLENLPRGTHKIQYSFLGYTNHAESLQVKDENIIVNVKLHESAIEMEELVVSGGYSSTQHENAVKIEILKLNLRNIESSPNFMEMITKVPGVDMISKGSGVSKPVIRGLSMNDILVLNNGVRF